MHIDKNTIIEIKYWLEKLAEIKNYESVMEGRRGNTGTFLKYSSEEAQIRLLLRKLGD